MTSGYLELPKRTEKQVRDARLAERNKLNAPWPGMPVQPEFNKANRPKPIIIDQDTGPRAAVRCPVPGIHLPKNVDRRRVFEADLVKYFGGFTSNAFQGGWKSETGEIMIEKGRVYEVSGRLTTFETDLARMLFCKLGMDLGEQWMHIEVRTFDALHSKVNETSSERPVATIWRPRTDPGSAFKGPLPLRDKAPVFDKSED